MKRRLTLALVTAVLGAALTAGAVQAQTEDEIQVARGRALVTRNCSQCHAVARADRSADPAAPPFRDLHERYDVEVLGEALAEGILTGHPAMPEFRFQPDEIVAIIRYLRSIQGKAVAAR